MQDHGPDSGDEFRRIDSLSPTEFPLKLLFVYDKANVFRKYECPLVFLEDGTKDPKFVENPWGNELRPTNVRYDPAVYAVTPHGVAMDVTCIAMTRSMGDFYAHQFGLSHEPDVSLRLLDPDLNYTIAIGTDGVWDCWRFDDFSDFVHQCNTQHLSIKDFTEKVLNESIKRAIQNFGPTQYDDASMVLMRVNAANVKGSTIGSNGIGGCVANGTSTPMESGTSRS